MFTEYYVLAIMTGFLTCKQSRMEDLTAYFGDSFELNEVFKSGTVSIAGAAVENAPTSFNEWIILQRNKGCVSLRVSVQGVSDPRYPSHKLAGFAGGRASCIEMHYDHGVDVYTLGSISSPNNALLAESFVRLIDCQENPDFFWDFIWEEVNEFNSMNDMDNIERPEIRSYMTSPWGRHAWEKSIGDNLFREIQVEALTYEIGFVIPDELRAMVEPVEPSPFLLELDEHVWLEAIDDDVDGDQLVQLVNAQNIAQRVWERCSDKHQLMCDLDDVGHDFPQIDAQQWPGYLRLLSADEAVDLVDVIVELVRSECEAKNFQPHIPESLSDVFGPDIVERTRLHYRWKLQLDTGWRLVESEDRWLTYLFKCQPKDSRVAIFPTKVSESRDEFESALIQAEKFALEIASPYAECFRFALFLSKKSHSVASGINAAAITAELAAAMNFSEDLINRLDSTFKLIDALSRFGWSDATLYSLAAISASDVFGAMGSWNDQSFEEPLAATFETVSARLFSAINRHFGALLAYPL